jgi:hypothetical protein
LGFTVNNDFWQGVPSDISPRKIHQGADVFLQYIFPMDKKGHLSFYTGIGLGMHNFYHQALLGVGKYNVNGTLPEGVGANESFLYNAPATINGEDITVKKSKISLTYFDVPVGFQYKAANKFHAALGLKVGWKVNAHTLYKGSDLNGSGFNVREKSLALRNIDKFHYGPYFVFGYKWFGASVFYQISSVFEKDLGPQIHPLSVGVIFKSF